MACSKKEQGEQERREMEVGAKYTHHVYSFKYLEPWVGITYSKRTEHGFLGKKKKKIPTKWKVSEKT